MNFKNFDINKFNEEFRDSERLAIDYVYKTIIKNIDSNFNEFTKDKIEIKNYYLKNLWNTLSYYQECLWLCEEYSFDNDFSYDIYFDLRDNFYKELGLKFNENSEKWEF